MWLAGSLFWNERLLWRSFRFFTLCSPSASVWGITFACCTECQSFNKAVSFPTQRECELKVAQAEN
jgi:hypothetical protein